MNNENKTLAIGTIFTYNGNKYKVCKYKYGACSQCAFNGINCDTIKDIRGMCTYNIRIDHTEVYYKQINNKTMKKDSGNIICPTFNTNDSLNDLHVECPKGYSIDVEHTDLSKGIIKFKKDNIAYIDIEDTLNLEEDLTGVPANIHNVRKLSAIDKLINIAKYYNKDWKPDWSNSDEFKYYIVFDYVTICIKQKVDLKYMIILYILHIEKMLNLL